VDWPLSSGHLLLREHRHVAGVFVFVFVMSVLSGEGEVEAEEVIRLSRVRECLECRTCCLVAVTVSVFALLSASLSHLLLAGSLVVLDVYVSCLPISMDWTLSTVLLSLARLMEMVMVMGSHLGWHPGPVRYCHCCCRRQHRYRLRRQCCSLLRRLE
jgi:hypothetical protein